MTPVVTVGKVLVTPEALDTLLEIDLIDGLGRHMFGDWGDVPDDVRAANDRGLIWGNGYLGSRYWSLSGVQFWIITHPDRQRTVVTLEDLTDVL